MNGKDFILLLNEQGYIQADASHVQVIASIGGYLSVTAEYKAEPTNEGNLRSIDNDDLKRLNAIEAGAVKLVELLNKGEVDYDLVANLEKVING